jgi:hypothetical protein
MIILDSRCYVHIYKFSDYVIKMGSLLLHYSISLAGFAGIN